MGEKIILSIALAIMLIIWLVLTVGVWKFGF